MAFMDDVLGKMSQAGQSVSKKARDLTEYAKYSGTISDSETEIRELYSEIGYKVYLAYRDRPLPEVAPQIQRITALNKIIEDARAAQKALNESDKCPRCGTRIQPGMLFCNNCGYRLTPDNAPQGAPAMQAPARFCMSCGAPMAPDAIFCMSCGARFEETPAAAPAQPVSPPASDNNAPVYGAPINAAAPAPAMPAAEQAPSYTDSSGFGSPMASAPDAQPAAVPGEPEAASYAYSESELPEEKPAPVPEQPQFSAFAEAASFTETVAEAAASPDAQTPEDAD